MVATLGAAKRQMVEIARAVHHNAEVIIFDEPTATLTPEEKRHFFALMRRLKARGVSIVFISHALEEALAHRRPHHHPARRRAGGHRRYAGLRPRQDRRAPWSGRTLSGEIYRQRDERRPAAQGRREGAVGAGHLDGQRRAQQFLLDLRGPDHRRVRPDRLRPHRDLQDRLRHLQARLPARRRDRAATTGRCATTCRARR